MIKALRVDHRLLHGQVAFSWTSQLGADCILLSSDTLLDDELRMRTIRMAKPTGVRVVAKNYEDSINAIQSGVTDKYKLFVIAETIEGASKLAKALDIKEINLGGTLPTADKEEIGTSVFVSKEDKEILNSLMDDGIHCYIQGVPSNKAIDVSTLI